MEISRLICRQWATPNRFNAFQTRNVLESFTFIKISIALGSSWLCEVTQTVAPSPVGIFNSLFKIFSYRSFICSWHLFLVSYWGCCSVKTAKNIKSYCFRIRLPVCGFLLQQMPKAGPIVEFYSPFNLNIMALFVFFVDCHSINKLFCGYSVVIIITTSMCLNDVF